jgi:ABC-type transporter Mla subunit MlaD
VTTPTDPLVRLAALERAVQDLIGWRATATTTVGQIQSGLANGGQRIGALEAAVQPFAERLTQLETAARNIAEAQATIQERQTVFERAAADISVRLDTLGRVARPGRSVIRQDVNSIQAQLQEILDRLPPQEEAGSGTT